MSVLVTALLMIPAAWGHLWLRRNGWRLTASSMWLFLGGFLFGREVGLGRILLVLLWVGLLAIFTPGLVGPAIEADRRLR